MVTWGLQFLWRSNLASRVLNKWVIWFVSIHFGSYFVSIGGMCSTECLSSFIVHFRSLCVQNHWTVHLASGQAAEMWHCRYLLLLPGWKVNFDVQLLDCCCITVFLLAVCVCVFQCGCQPGAFWTTVARLRWPVSDILLLLIDLIWS